jgi:hypothetical protein
MIKIISISILYVFFALCAFSQNTLSISGNVKNQTGQNVESATVYVDGGSKYSKTDLNGDYSLSNLTPGTYNIAVSIVGYAPQKKNVILKNSSGRVSFIINEQQIALKEVVIGSNSKRKELLKTFIERFIGPTENAKNCEILNTDIIEFTTEKAILMATSPDYLVIENRNLGYRIKYLLKRFTYDAARNLTSYAGDCIFEEMKGSLKERAKWAVNRRKVYFGSFMHYLRSIYAGSDLSAGFKTFAFIDPKQRLLKKEPVDMKKYISKIDSTFIRFSFGQTLTVVYDRKSVFKLDRLEAEAELSPMDFARLGLRSTEISLYLDYTLIDRNGNYLDYRSFLLHGHWGNLQIGDRLPLDYDPVL